MGCGPVAGGVRHSRLVARAEADRSEAGCDLDGSRCVLGLAMVSMGPDPGVSLGRRSTAAVCEDSMHWVWPVVAGPWWMAWPDVWRLWCAVTDAMPVAAAGAALGSLRLPRWRERPVDVGRSERACVMDGAPCEFGPVVVSMGPALGVSLDWSSKTAVYERLTPLLLRWWSVVWTRW